MIGIELFAGAGGMSLGAAMAGIDIKLAVEIDSYAAKTYSKNHTGVTVFNDDIRKLKKVPVKKGKRPTILFGGPPCQGFSLSNQKTRSKENSGNWLFTEFIRIAKLWKPDWIVIENVSGMAITEKGYFLEQIIKEVESLGYTVNYKLLNAADYGVPQKRERLFIVGSLHGIHLEFPTELSDAKVSVADAISDLPLLGNGANFNDMSYKGTATSEYARAMRGKKRKSKNHLVTRNSDLVIKRYAHVPQGGNWQNIPAKLMSNYKDHTRCHGGIYKRLNERAPSVVIGNYRKNMLIHPTQDRGLSVREAARLQSFPDWFVFEGPLIYQQQHVGNAVPPQLAKAVFSAIIKTLQ